jgi:HD-GYP domain-containing protein (c-di-GMP phosphodiesterase class II)
MLTFAHDHTEEDILHDLMEEINELYEASEQTLIELEIKPDDNELQRALFRQLHTIKGDLGLVGFAPMLPLMQHVEDLLDMLRKGQIMYTSNMSDVVLQSMDQVKQFVKMCIQDGKTEYDDELLHNVIILIKDIAPNQNAENEVILAQAAATLQGQSPKANTKLSIDTLNQASLTKSGIPKDLAPLLKADMLFFRELMQPIEKRVLALQGRGDRIAQMAHLINTYAGLPISPEQLSVACYMHDFGMAFMPIAVLHKQEKLEEVEFNLMRSHVYKSARLLENLNQWNEARKIVMQHHERIDGSGYPLGIKEVDICEGAKLLAILDTFDAITHARAHEGHLQRPKKKAVIEINRIAKGQFSTKWMQAFNSGMAALLTNERAK